MQFPGLLMILHPIAPPNPSKTWLVTKQGHFDKASNTFAGSGVNVTLDGRPYLGAVIGSQEYVEEYVSSKVRAWSSSINILRDIAKSQPQAAFSALTFILNDLLWCWNVAVHHQQLLVTLKTKKSMSVCVGLDIPPVPEKMRRKKLLQ